MGECLAKIGSQLELGSGVNGGGEEEEDEAERRERPSGEGGFTGCQGKKRGVSRVNHKNTPPSRYFCVPS